MKIILTLLGCTIAMLTFAQANHTYKIIKTFHIGSTGGWDYIAINDNKLYVSHGAQVNILNKETGDSVGILTHTKGVHGIAFDKALGKGFTSNGRSNNVTVFDVKTNKVLAEIATGENPDAILFEPFSKTIITCNGKSKNLSVIDPKTQNVIHTIDVGGRPEMAVSNRSGKLFVNIEDKSEITVVDTKSFTVLNHWTIMPGKGPTGLAMDIKTNRLFAGCDNKLLMVINAENGNIVDKLSIGAGCDGVVFDEKNKIIYTSNGEGTVSVYQENTSDNFSLLKNIPTKRGARTLALDEKTGTLFLPTAEWEASTATNPRPKMIPGTFQVLVIQ